MTIKSLDPYLFFNGNAEKAIQLYERVLGAKTESLQRFSDMPASAGPSRPEYGNRVMHASMRIGEKLVMVSDCPPNESVPAGSNVHLCLDFDDAQEMAQKFQALAASGKVCMALQDVFWGAKFGTLVDEYGIHWMFNCDTNAK